MDNVHPLPKRDTKVSHVAIAMAKLREVEEDRGRPATDEEIKRALKPEPPPAA